MFALLLFLVLQAPVGLDRGLLAPPDNPVTQEKADLGRRLFFDTALSADDSLACADCHQPARAFTDGRKVAMGIGGPRGSRNTPTIINRTYGRSFFWDGRIQSLEEQVLQPIQQPSEMGTDVPTVVERLRADSAYRAEFEEVFGTPPDARSLSQALATFVRTLLSGASRYDRYQAGDSAALSPLEQQGLRLFRGKANCANCHAGSNLSDEELHNTGVSWGREPYDKGRAIVTGMPEDTGKFKTPTLRDIEHTAPYMHDGSVATLVDVIAFYNRGGNANPYRDDRLRPLSLTAQEQGALVAFLRALSGASIVGMLPPHE